MTTVRFFYYDPNARIESYPLRNIGLPSRRNEKNVELDRANISDIFDAIKNKTPLVISPFESGATGFTFWNEVTAIIDTSLVKKVEFS